MWVGLNGHFGRVKAYGDSLALHVFCHYDFTVETRISDQPIRYKVSQQGSIGIGPEALFHEERHPISLWPPVPPGN